MTGSKTDSLLCKECKEKEVLEECACYPYCDDCFGKIYNLEDKPISTLRGNS